MAKYVGKRVVPKLCGAWNDRTKYEMLSVVLEESTGDSYVARKEVPAGTGLNQTDYWALSSRYSQQYQNLSDQLTETLRQVRADNDETETTIRQNNTATAQAIAQDNTNTRNHVDETVAAAIANLAEGRAEMNSTKNTLNARMDSIAGGETEETEVLDARVDVDDTTHENLGVHIRSIGAKQNVEKDALRHLLDTAEGVETEDVEFDYVTSSVIDVGGEVKYGENLGEYYRVSDPVNVEPGSIYCITASGYYRKYLYAFYDIDGNFLEGLYEASTTDVNHLWDKLIVAPPKAAKLRIAWIQSTNLTGKIGRVTTIIFPTGRLTGDLLKEYEGTKALLQTVYEQMLTDMTSDLALLSVSEDVELNDAGDSLIDPFTGEIKGLVTPSDSYRASDFIRVTPLEILRLSACSHYGYDLYAWYDSEQNFLRGLRSAQGGTYTRIDDEMLIVPLDASYIRIAWKRGEMTGKLERMSQTGYRGVFEGTFRGTIEGDVTGNISGTLTGDYLKWGGKKWTVVGDSHTEHNIRATKNYHDYVAEKTGITVVNLGKSGAGYKRQEENNKAFYQLVASIPEDSDVVTIYGSGNDLSQLLGEVTDTGTETLCGCINTTIDNFNARLPGTPLGIVTPSPWSNANPSNDNCAMARYSAAIVEICRRRSIPCLDLYHCSNLRPWEASFRELFYTRDDGGGCHPDENGHAILAPRFAAFLEQLIL